MTNADPLPAFSAALVTGAGDRLGRAMALSLAKSGLKVAVHYSSNSDGADETLRLIDEAAGKDKAVKLQSNLLDDAATQELIPKAAAALGQPLDVLINNASIFEHDTVATASQESWDRHIGSNLKAPLFLTQAFAAQARPAVPDGRGEPYAQAAIINMIDMRVRKLTPEFMTYTLAKSALWTLTQTSAQALAPNIRVNGIGPGPTLKAERQTEENFAEQRRKTVLSRGANAEDITRTMDYILRSPAITGQLICVDGGQHLGWKTPDVLGVIE